MKKILLSISIVFLCLSTLSAYNITLRSDLVLSGEIKKAQTGIVYFVDENYADKLIKISYELIESIYIGD